MQLRRTCYEMNKEGFNLRAADPPARKAGPLPVRIYGFPKDAGGKGARRVRTTTSRQRIPAEERGATRRLVFVFSHIPSGGGAKRRMREEHFGPEG
jgi:hypothetical protein